MSRVGAAAGQVWTVVGDAVAVNVRGWRRSVLLGLGVVLGVGSFVATIGISSTASAQVSARFDAFRATEVVLRRNSDTQRTEADFPADSDQRLERLSGVVAGGRICRVEQGRVLLERSIGSTAARVPIVGAGRGAWSAAVPRLAAGRGLTPLDDEMALPVAVVGSGAAAALEVRVGSSLLLGGAPLTVVGIIDGTERRPDFMAAVVVPVGTVDRLIPGGCDRAEVLVATRPGAAALVGRQAPPALVPHGPESVTAEVPPDPAALRREVEAEVVRLYLLLAVVALVMSVVVIANAASISVIERTREIGVLRALGASRREVRLQFMAESAVLGAAGGAVGASVGVAVTLGAGLVQRWVPVLDVRLVGWALLLGVVTGMLGGLLPAHRAASIEAAEALRR